MTLTKVTYSMIQGAPKSALDYGADNTGSADSTSALQALFNAGGVVMLPAGDYKITAPVTINSGVTGVLWYGRVISTYAGAQDTDVHPSVIFDGFSGFIDGLLHLEIATSTSSSTSDGVQFLDCDRIWVAGIKLKNQRFGVVMTTTDNFYVGYIDADTMRGWQAGGNDNGGSIITMSGCQHGRIDQINGINVYKAAVYFSVDGVSGDNFDVHVGDISVALINPTTSVANGITLRSAVNVTVQSLRSTGGIAGLYCSREETTYNVDQVKIGSVYVEDNTLPSSNSSSVVIQGEVTNPVGSIEIGSIYAKNSINNSVLILYANSVKIGSLVSIDPGQRGVLIADVNGIIQIDNLDMSGAANQEVYVSAGTTDQLILGNVIIRDRGANIIAPINVVAGTVADVQIGTIIDETTAPAYTAPTVFGAPAATVNLEIGYVKTAATYAASVRLATIDAIVQGRFYQATIPSTSTWPLGTEIYKTSPTSGSNNSWVLTTTGFKATANLA